MLLHRRDPIPIDDDVTGSRLILTEGVKVAIGRLLPRKVGRQFHENVLYLAGRRIDSGSLAVSVLQPGVMTWPGEYRTSPEAHAAAFRLMRHHRLEMVGQVHCHPGRCVEHSDGDDADAVLLTEGYWSLVVPRYGRDGLSPATAGFHCYSAGAFRLLSSAATEQRIVIAPGVLVA
ncbi:MAG: Mov34/MPN/PAD-1 family protein [Fimbriimonadaceae bacterium]